MLSSSATSTDGTFYKTTVRTALQNGAECQAIKKKQEHNTSAPPMMWMLRQMQGITRKDRRTRTRQQSALSS